MLLKFYLCSSHGYFSQYSWAMKRMSCNSFIYYDRFKFHSDRDLIRKSSNKWNKEKKNANKRTIESIPSFYCLLLFRSMVHMFDHFLISRCLYIHFLNINKIFCEYKIRYTAFRFVLQTCIKTELKLFGRRPSVWR